jgi:hypothetical protein
MGKRTKYQQTEYAQLYLEATSSLTTNKKEINNTSTSPHSGSAHILEQQQAQSESNILQQQVQETATLSTDKQDKKVSDDESVTVVGGSSMEESEANTGWQHGEWELGRRLVRGTEAGEEAAVREVRVLWHHIVIILLCKVHNKKT